METLTQTLVNTAARLAIEEGLDYAHAKRRAVKLLGLPPRTALPDNTALEAEIRIQLALFHAETHPQELAALRRLATLWMERLAQFRPHLSGAVWRGTATRHSDIVLQLFCDDPKSAEIALIDHQVRYSTHTHPGVRGADTDTLSFSSFCPELNEAIGIHLMVHDHDALRGALKPGPDGLPLRGDLRALQALLQHENSP